MFRWKNYTVAGDINLLFMDWFQRHFTAEPPVTSRLVTSATTRMERPCGRLADVGTSPAAGTIHITGNHSFGPQPGVGSCVLPTPAVDHSAVNTRVVVPCLQMPANA